MALQHFYSRVPAKMSLFNRTDSFDTFAYSSGLEREFIEKDLSAVYDNKPSKNDAALIRTGKLKPVYCQYFTKSDKLVQGTISYLPLDYTGERSAYLSHILVPDEAEEKEILSNPDNAVFNPKMFKNDIEGFKLTDENAKPDTDYKPLKYEPAPAESTEILLSYDSAMMKRLIFAMLNIACGKGKNIFVSMPYKMSSFSEESLKFMNTLLQIFPYHLRRAFSFLTYTDDGTRYNGFNIRFVPEGVPEIPLAKGMTLHFGSKIAIGLSDEMVINNNHIVEFFYNLIKNDAVRREFLSFTENAVEIDPTLKKVNLRTMTELVFLFEQCSGLFDEKVILPNDVKVYDFVCAYEKHRNALSEEYRADALKCLERYPDNHMPIPKDVFAKITRIYPAEIYASKKVIMGVVLELIHTDLMRDKLFAFVKSNYESEEPSSRSEISLNLCRVYYGGFLQPQILAFFEEIFKNESEETKTSIVDKLLLTVRTPAIRQKIIEFFDNNYESLSENQKESFYNTFFEMVPECDALTNELISLVNKHIGAENSERKNLVAEKLLNFVKADLKKKEPKLLKILLSSSGESTTAVIAEIFKSHSNDEVFSSLIKELKKVSNRNKIKIIDNIWFAVPDMDWEVAQKWAEETCKLEAEEPAEWTLFELIEFDKSLSLLLSEGGAKEIFAKKMLDDNVRPLLCSKLSEAFTAKAKGGLKSVIEYAEDKPYITFAPEYKPIGDFVKFCDAFQKQKHSEMTELVSSLCETHINKGAAEQLKSATVNSKDFADEKYDLTKMLARALISFVNSKEFGFYDIYSDYFASAVEKMLGANEGMSQETAEGECARKAMGYMLKAAEAVFVSPSFAEYRSVVVEAGGEISVALADFAGRQKKAQRWTDEYLSFNKFDKTFSDRVLSLFEGIKVSSGGFLKRLFKK